MATLPDVKEFVSIKVSSFDHAALATSLTSKAADGWDVVSVVAVGNDIVAYLSRETLSGSTGTKSSTVSSTVSSSSASAPVATASGTSEPAGWAAATTTDAASAPTQAMSTTAAAETSSATTNATASSTTPSVPADWYKDPSGRYEYRYWDGQRWTEHVSRAGTVYKDPPTP